MGRAHPAPNFFQKYKDQVKPEDCKGLQTPQAEEVGISFNYYKFLIGNFDF